jgi:hypothetical protein
LDGESQAGLLPVGEPADCPARDDAKEERNARARLVCLKYVPRINKEVAAGSSRIDEARACNPKIMPALTYLNLLVVTARAAWYNFRRCKRRP